MLPAPAERIDDEPREVLEKYDRSWINLHLQPPRRDHPQVSREPSWPRAVSPDRQPEACRWPGSTTRPSAALAHKLVVPGSACTTRRCDCRGLGTSGTPRRQGLRMHGEGLRGHTPATWSEPTSSTRPAAAEHRFMPNYLISYSTTRSRSPQRRGLYHDLRGARGTRPTTSRRAPDRQHERLVAGPVRRAGAARGRADAHPAADRRDTHARGNTEAHRLQDLLSRALRRRRHRGQLGRALVRVLDLVPSQALSASRRAWARSFSPARGLSDSLGAREVASCYVVAIASVMLSQMRRTKPSRSHSAALLRRARVLMARKWPTAG